MFLKQVHRAAVYSAKGRNVVDGIRRIDNDTKQTMPTNLEGHTVEIILEEVSLPTKTKKGDLTVCGNYHTVSLVSHANKNKL